MTKSIIIAGLGIVFGTILTASGVCAEQAASQVARRERPAIQAALDALFAAEKANDVAAIRRAITRGTREVWDRDGRDTLWSDVREGGVESQLFDPKATGVEITSIAIDPKARWAAVHIKGRKGLSDDVYLFREEGLWKVSLEYEDTEALFMYGLSPHLPPAAAAHVLADTIPAAGDLPAGWTIEPDDISAAALGRHSYLAEIAAYNLVRDGRSPSTLRYRLFTNADYAEWYCWRVVESDAETVMTDKSGAPTRVVADAVTLVTESHDWMTVFVRKGAIVGEVTVRQTANSNWYVSDVAQEIAGKMLRRLGSATE